MQKPAIDILIYALVLITYDFNIGIYVLTKCSAVCLCT